MQLLSKLGTLRPSKKFLSCQEILQIAFIIIYNGLVLHFHHWLYPYNKLGLLLWVCCELFIKVKDVQMAQIGQQYNRAPFCEPIRAELLTSQEWYPKNQIPGKAGERKCNSTHLLSTRVVIWDFIRQRVMALSCSTGRIKTGMERTNLS